MGRFGMAPEEALAALDPRPRGRLMSHLATADEADGLCRAGRSRAFAVVVSRASPAVPAHIANSAATLRFPDARFDAVRCGVALYGLSPFGDDPAEHGLEPVLSWRSYVALAKVLQAGESTGYGRRFVAERETRIGIVPVGYGDGFRRGLTGTEVLVGGTRRRVLGTISMDSFAVELGDEPEGAPVTLVGDGLLVEEHARRLGTMNYEITCGARLRPSPCRAPERRWIAASRTAVAGVEAYVVGGAVRDDLVGRQVVDVDVATPDPEVAARIYAGLAKGAIFPLSERHGAWRVAFKDGTTVDFTPLAGTIEDDLRTRDFTINAIAQPVAGGEYVDPLHGRADLEARTLRAVSETVFEDDPLRLLRAVRLEDELGFRARRRDGRARAAHGRPRRRAGR